MKRVIIESPYAPANGRTVEDHLRYLRACMADSIHFGEAPYASHALYTQPGVLRDDVPGERKLGIDSGFAWRACADLTVFYVDLGWSSGMKAGQADCEAKGTPFEIRSLGAWEPGLCATDRWGAPTGVVTGSVAPMRAEDVRMPLEMPLEPLEQQVGRVLAEHDGIHTPVVLALEPEVVVGQATLDHAIAVARGLFDKIGEMPLTKQAGDTIAVVLALLHYHGLKGA